MKISIGADHRGYDLKTKIIKHFSDIEWSDVGTNSTQRTDYPIFAKKVCNDVLQGRTSLGILICGSGVGMAIAANRFAKIYAALCWNEDVARLAKADDKANILVLPTDFVMQEKVFSIINVWLSTEFRDGIHQKRLKMIDE